MIGCVPGVLSAPGFCGEYSMQKFKTFKQLRTYGCGDTFDISKFRSVVNVTYGHHKPADGGLWTSPVESEWGWRQWGESENYGNFDHSFDVEFAGSVYEIDNYADLEAIPKGNTERKFTTAIDFERLVNEGIDAIHLTIAGQIATRFIDRPFNMYGWDCETVLILNPLTIKEIV